MTKPLPGHDSLRRRLVVLLGQSIVIGLLLVGIGVFLSAREELDEIFDAQLAQSARTLLELPIAAGHSLDDGPVAAVHAYEHKLAYVLRDTLGRVVQHSRFADLSAIPSQCSGYSDRDVDNARWRIICMASASRHVVVGQRLDIRNELAFKIVTSQFLPFLLALPLIGGLAWVALGRGLRPLETLSAEIAWRTPRDLRPVSAEGAPSEVVPLVAELNRLLERVATTMEHERRFTADAAHELRTPLAALRTQAEVARNEVPDGVAARALDNVIVGVDRAAHLVTQLLALARLDHAADIKRLPVALYPLAQQVIGDLAETALAKRLDLSLSGERDTWVYGDQNLLQILLRNLADNAVRYTPPGGEVAVRLTPGLIEVLDSGPGICPEQRERVLQRFFRGEHGDSTGSGLGLSIAARVAQLHGATLEFGSGIGKKGLSCQVRFSELAVEAPSGMRSEPEPQFPEIQ